MIEVAPLRPTPQQTSLARAARRLAVNEPVTEAPEGAAVAALSVARLRDARGAALDAAIAEAAALTGVADRRLAATWISGWFVYWVIGPALVTWLDERRVPPLDPDEVAVWWTGTSGAYVCLGDGRWAVLPDDPLTASGDVDVLADGTALATELHDRIVAVLEPLFAGMQDAERVGLRQQWLQARDRIASILQDSAREAGHEQAGITAARSLIDRPGSPLAAHRGGFESYRVSPRELRVVYHRATCCLALRGPDGSPCLTCPARPASATREAVVATLIAGTSPQG